MNIFITYLLSIFVMSSSYAGGSHAKVKIKNFYEDKEGRTIFEVKWGKGSELLSNNLPTKFIFEYHNWPFRSYIWLTKYFPWSPNLRSRYPKEEFDKCIEMIKIGFQTNSEINLGQMGSVEFVRMKDNVTGIIPYANIYDVDKGEKACFLYASEV